MRFGEIKDKFLLSSGGDFKPNFSLTDAPENWWRTSRFGSSQRFVDVDKDKYRFPKVGQYDPPPSSVVLSSPSATRPSFQDRRPRVTAPANGAVAEARKWGADKWLEAPDPGPGHYYNPGATTFDAGNKGCTSSFMRSVRPRFPGDKGAGFLKVKHKLSPDAARKAKLPSFDLEASLRRPSRRRRRQRPRTSHSARKPRVPQTSARPLTAPAAHNLSWASGLDGPSGSSRGGPGVGTSVSQMARSQRRAMTPAQRREAFDLAEELQRVKELDFFSYRQMGKHHKVQKMVAKQEASKAAVPRSARAS